MPFNSDLSKSLRGIYFSAIITSFFVFKCVCFIFTTSENKANTLKNMMGMGDENLQCIAKLRNLLIWWRCSIRWNVSGIWYEITELVSIAKLYKNK